MHKRTQKNTFYPFTFCFFAAEHMRGKVTFEGPSSDCKICPKERPSHLLSDTERVTGIDSQ